MCCVTLDSRRDFLPNQIMLMMACEFTYIFQNHPCSLHGQSQSDGAYPEPRHLRLPSFSHCDVKGNGAIFGSRRRVSPHRKDEGAKPLLWLLAEAAATCPKRLLGDLWNITLAVYVFVCLGCHRVVISTISGTKGRQGRFLSSGCELSEMNFQPPVEYPSFV